MTPMMLASSGIVHGVIMAKSIVVSPLLPARCCRERPARS
jgi:hypothetical protein